MKGSFDPHATFRRAAVKHAKPREDRDFVVEQHEKNGLTAARMELVPYTGVPADAEVFRRAMAVLRAPGRGWDFLHNNRGSRFLDLTS